MLNRPMKACPAWIILALLSMVLTACAPRTVYIPPEWHEPPPKSTTAQARAKTTAQQPQAPPSSQQFVLQAPPSIKEAEVPPTAESKPAPAQKASAEPQHLASMHLVDQAKTALAQGKTDAAISLFEQAVQVDVYNGDAFFGLARAWRMKGSRDKTVEFARKAEILFQDDPAKLKELYLFEAGVFKDLGDKTREDIYRRKAARL